MEISLREKKKAETRTAIYNAAATLFKQKGFTETTLSDIAAAANISQRTIFYYYPSKEAIIFDNSQKFIDLFLVYIKERGNTSVFEAIRSFPMNENRTTYLHSGTLSDIHSLVAKTPALQEYLSHILSKVEKQVVLLIAKEQKLPADSLQAQLVASVIRAVISYKINYKNADENTTDIAMRFIEGGLRESTNNE